MKKVQHLFRFYDMNAKSPDISVGSYYQKSVVVRMSSIVNYRADTDNNDSDIPRSAIARQNSSLSINQQNKRRYHIILRYVEK